MPLGARDIMMVVRARDLASRTLRNVGTNLGVMGTHAGAVADKLFNVGSALTTIGLTTAAVGAAGVTWLEHSTDAAIKYNNEAAKTLTQIDQTGVKLETVKNIARDVAREIPAPFEEMQSALYDIFSSMDVNVGGAKILLREFSRAGVAGQVDLQSAARGTIGIMNSYQMKAEDVTRVNDIMFQLVRKGVGTYQEFADTVGLATPAAVRAGQSFETLAGMMAFMTRNGMDASAASAAAGRALENLANPTIVKRLEGMGVAVKDASGEFRPMVDIVGQLHDKLGNLTAPERAAALQELLKGAGNSVQARRFWNMAIQNFDQFNSLTQEMINSSGALDDAYKIMFEQPQSQIQLLKNNYEVLRTEVGDKLIPVKLKLAKIVLSLIDKWNSLSEGTKSLIIKIAAFTSVFLLVGGVIMTVVGAGAMMIAVLMSMGATLGGAIAIIGGFMGAMVAIPIIIFLIIKHFDTLKNVAGTTWNFIKDVGASVWQWMQAFLNWLSTAVVPIVKDIWETISSVTTAAIKVVFNVIQFVLNIIQGNWSEAWENVKNIFVGAWQMLWASISGSFNLLMTLFRELPGRILGFIGNVGSLLWQKGSDIMTGMWRGLINGKDIIVGWLRSVPGELLNVFGSVGSLLFNVGKQILNSLWEGMKSVWNSAKNWVGGLGGAIVDLKGPPAKDKILLVNNGRLIMQGLQRGLQTGWSDVEKELDRMTNSLNPNFSVSGGYGASNAPVNQVTGSGLTVMGDLVVREEAVTSDLDWWARTGGTGV